MEKIRTDEGARLRHIRRAHDIVQEELAARAGFSKQTIVLAEKGAASPAAMQKILSALVELADERSSAE